jgi:hypothetical protein
LILLLGDLNIDARDNRLFNFDFLLKDYFKNKTDNFNKYLEVELSNNISLTTEYNLFISILNIKF